jgi:hypothetical protein
MSQVWYKNRHFWLSIMGCTYVFPIYLMYSVVSYTNSSISKLFATSFLVVGCLIVMGISTVIYELVARENTFVIGSILFMLFGLIGIFKYDETLNIHFLYAIMAFASMLSFTVLHVLHFSTDVCLIVLSTVQSIAFLFMIYVLTVHRTLIDDIFGMAEIVFIIAFNIAYLYVHFRNLVVPFE